MQLVSEFYAIYIDTCALCLLRILGKRVSELENKLKTLEVAGLWSLPGECFFNKFLATKAT